MNDLIQWPTAKYWQAQWNYAIGCHKVSPACQNCWASEWAKRFKQSFEPHCSSKDKPPKKGICFVGNLSDMFGEWCDRLCPPEYYIGQAVMQNGDATYLWLTKRPQRMAQALNGTVDIGTQRVPIMDFFSIQERHYFGFTAENQEWFDMRSDALENTLCRSGMYKINLWLSAEPLLGPIELRGEICKHLSWVVVGAESGSNRRPCNIEWVEDIVDECLSLGIPTFVKQVVLPSGKFTNKIEDFPKHLQIRQVPWLVHEERGEYK